MKLAVKKTCSDLTTEFRSIPAVRLCQFVAFYRVFQNTVSRRVFQGHVIVL